MHDLLEGTKEKHENHAIVFLLKCKLHLALYYILGLLKVNFYNRLTFSLLLPVFLNFRLLRPEDLV
jgi:hypothetical protein